MLSEADDTVPRCPSCGSGEIVRVPGSRRVFRLPKARCILCEQTFEVSRADFRGLRLPEPDELAKATQEERLGHMFESPMTGGQIAVALAGAAIGSVLGFQLEVPLLVFGGIVAGWWLGGLLFPRSRHVVRRAIESRRCVMCNYSMRGLPDGHRCPECGHPFDPAALRAAGDARSGRLPPERPGRWPNDSSPPAERGER